MGLGRTRLDYIPPYEFLAETPKFGRTPKDLQKITRQSLGCVARPAPCDCVWRIFVPSYNPASSASSLRRSPCSLSVVVLLTLISAFGLICSNLCDMDRRKLLLMLLFRAINSELKKIFVQRLLSDKASG